MSTYEILDLICDAIGPVLLLGSLILLLRLLSLRSWREGGQVALCLVLGLGITYGLYFTDRALGLWPSFGGDYSTHTAFALAVASPLALFTRFRLWVAALLVLYGVLMMIQRYHSLLDLLTTAAAFLFLFGSFWWLAGSRRRRAKPPNG